MFVLAHLSDLHYTPLPDIKFLQLCNKRLLGYSNFYFKRRHQYNNKNFQHLMEDLKKHTPDHVVISGDIVNFSLPQEFVQARQWLQQQGDPQDISLTLGNHDCYVLGAYKKACKAFLPWLAEKNEPAPLLFPSLRQRGCVALINVRSALAMPPFFAAGYFSPEAEKRLRIILRQCKEKKLFRVIFLHHPPLGKVCAWHSHLFGYKRLQDLLREEGAELVLCGHTHKAEIFYLNGADDKQIPIVSAACASQNFDNHHQAAQYNLFEITQGKNQGWQCTLKNYAIINKQRHISCVAQKQLF